MDQEPPGNAAAAIGLVHRMLGDHEAGWSVGTFGAIAEFHHVEGDSPADRRLTSNGGELVTAAGAMRIELTEAVLPVAFEGLSKREGAWTHSVAFCLPLDVARGGVRSVLSELGPDAGALRSEDRGGVLFDMGVDAPHIDFCVRTADPDLIAILRLGAGQSVLAANNKAMAAIKAHSPHRVCMSRLGRVEVYSAIPADSPGAMSPVGPHTHLLPKLLKAGRTHSANTPIPAGWVPAFDLHPGGPLADRLGRPRAFDRAAHAAFQEVLEIFGPPGYAAEKQRVRDAVRSGMDPSAYRPAATRAKRRAARVALRQMRCTDPAVTGIEDWLMALDRGDGACGAEAR